MLINALLDISNTTFCDYRNWQYFCPTPQQLFIKNPVVPHESNSLIEYFYSIQFRGYVPYFLNY